MGKILIIVIPLIVIALIFYIYLAGGDGDERNSNFAGNSSHLKEIIRQLMLSSRDDSFVIVKVTGTEDFVQFSRDYQGIQLDFPMVTDHQKEMKDTILRVGNDLGLKHIENKGTDGSSFIDFNITGEPEDIGDAVNTFLELLFKTNTSTELEYECWGVDLNVL